MPGACGKSMTPLRTGKPALCNSRRKGESYTSAGANSMNGVIGEYAASVGCPTPLFAATQPVYDAAMAAGHAMHDTAAVCAVLEAKAGVKRGKTTRNTRKR